MKATRIAYDIIVGTASGNVSGLDLPDKVPVERLRAVPTEEGDFELVDIEKITQFYIDGAGQKHLSPIEVTWQALTCNWDDWLAFANGVWSLRSGSSAMAIAKARGRTVVADMAERERLRHITSGDGKAAVYLIKREEVLRYRSGSGRPIEPTDFPWMNARAQRLGVPLGAVALEWAGKVQNWEQIGRAIENAYEAAVDAIDALNDTASFEPDITRIIEGIRWP